MCAEELLAGSYLYSISAVVRGENDMERHGDVEVF